MASIVPAILVQEASCMAAAGDYQGAVALLEMIPAASSASALVLRAKIESQRRNYERAAEWWEQALDAAPESSDIQQGLRIARRLASSRLARIGLSLRPILAILVLAAVLALVGFAWWSGRGPSNAELAAAIARVEQHQNKAVRQFEISTVTSIKDLRERLKDVAEGLAHLRERAVEQTGKSTDLQQLLDNLVGQNQSVGKQLRADLGVAIEGMESMLDGFADRLNDLDREGLVSKDEAARIEEQIALAREAMDAQAEQIAALTTRQELQALRDEVTDALARLESAVAEPRSRWWK